MRNQSNLFFSVIAKYRRILAFAIGLYLVVAIALPIPGNAQSTVNQGRIAEIIDGSQVYIQNNQARVNDVANRGQQIRTGTARAQVSFNTGAIARLSSNSVLTVGQCAQLQRGTLLVNGAVNGCTSSVTAGVHGTTYVMSIDEEGQEAVKVLEGEVTVSRHASTNSSNTNTNPTVPAETSPSTPSTPSSPETPSTPSRPRGGLLNRLSQLNQLTKENQPTQQTQTEDTVVLQAGQQVFTRPGQPLGRPSFLTVDDFVKLLTGQLFDGFVSELPGLSRIQETFQQLFPGIPFPIGHRSILPF